MHTETSEPKRGGGWKIGAWTGRVAAIALTATGCLLIASGSSRSPKAAGVAIDVRGVSHLATPSPETPTASSSPARSRAIEDMRLGDRVLTGNPEGAAEGEAEVNPATWRSVELRLVVDDVTYEIALLRPDAWFDEVGARPGASIPLEMPEMGVSGQAQVLSVAPCPPIRPGTGRVVTGTFAHDAPALDLRLEGVDGPIGVTANHPIWSEDREEFVPAGELAIGERLRPISGEARVASITPRPEAERVYNIEVNLDHAYRVSERGILVHNDCGTVYRVIRNTEDPAVGLVAKDPTKTYKAAFHVTSGTRNPTQYISATKDIEVAMFYAQRDGLRIVAINTKLLKGVKIIDLTNNRVFGQLMKSSSARRLARSSREVLFKGFIPPRALKVIADFRP